MFKTKAGRTATAASAMGRVKDQVDMARAVSVIGDRMVQSLWPIEAVVLFTSPPVIVDYPEDDLGRVLEVLIGKALNACPPSDLNPQALVGCRKSGRAVFVSVRSGSANAFEDSNDWDYRLESPGYRTFEAKAIVEHNQGRFWVDKRAGEGAVACFTIPR